MHPAPQRWCRVRIRKIPGARVVRKKPRGWEKMHDPLGKKDERGFTLLELLVVLLILGIVSMIAVVELNSARQAAFRMTCRANVNTLQIAVELYHVDNGFYPPPGTVGSSHPLAGYTYGGIPSCPLGGVYVAREGDGLILVGCTVHGTWNGSGLDGVPFSNE